MDENEKSKMPEWLQDKKKLVIIILVVIAIIVSGVLRFVLVSSVATKLYSKVMGYGNQTKVSVIDNIISQLKDPELCGPYMNDNADEVIVFKEDGSLDYVAAGFTESGEWMINDNILTLTIGENLMEFEIVKNEGNELELTNGFADYSFTKLTEFDY